jgi:alkylhydroperoxidase/carboxymuconolactone decarboxylase family protein YurZ
LETSHKIGVTKEEMMEAMGIATLVGGTIVVPHVEHMNSGKHWMKPVQNSISL